MKELKARKKEGISLVALVITIIVLIVLTGAVVMTGVNAPSNAQLAVFKSNVATVQDAVTVKMLNNVLEYHDKNSENVKWIGVANEYEQDNVTTDPIFGMQINGVDVVQLDDSIKENLSISQEEFDKYYVDENGIVYHTGFAYKGVTYYNVNTSNLSVEKLEIKSLPSKLEYNAGENIDMAGLKVEATHSDGQTKDVTESVIFSPSLNEITKSTGIKEVTVSYGGVSANDKIAIKVNEAVITSIAITKYPSKLTYYVGESVDITGIEVTATYSDGQTGNISDNVIFEPSLSEVTKTAGTKEIVVKYSTMEAKEKINIVVNELVLSSIKIEGELEKTKYKQGESFDASGITVKAVYEGGIEKSIGSYQIEPNGELSGEDTSVTISYTENGVTKTVSQDIKVAVLNALEIVVEPENTTYVAGHEFDKSTIQVSANYAYPKYPDEPGYGIIVEDYEITSATKLQEGQTSIDLEYEDGGVTVQTSLPITVTNNVTKIEVTTQPTKTTYNHNEEFDKTGMVVTATYQNNETRELDKSEYTVSTPTYGQNYVTIAHTETGMTTIQAVTVNRVLDSVSLLKNPTKMVYNHNDGFDVTGMEVKATYTDGGTETITSGITGQSALLEYGDTTATATYAGHSITVTGITVNKVLQELQLAKTPNQVEYTYNDTFNSAGMQINAIYTHGEEVDVTSQCTLDTTTIAYSQTKVVATYETATVDIPLKVLQYISVTAPTQSKYWVGDKLNTTGLVVTAYYSDGTTANVTSQSTLTPANNTTLAVTNTAVRATYKTRSSSVTIRVYDTVANLITNDDIGEGVNYTGYKTNGIAYTDWIVLYKTSGYLFLTANQYSEYSYDLSPTGDTAAANSSSLYTIFKLGNAGYQLNSAYDTNKCVADLVLNFGCYANKGVYKTKSGGECVVGAIGGVTVELFVAAYAEHTNTTPIVYSYPSGKRGYAFGSEAYNIVSITDDGILSRGFNHCWLASPNQTSDNGVCTSGWGSLGYVDYTESSANLRPAVCLSLSTPAWWNASTSKWEIGY